MFLLNDQHIDAVEFCAISSSLTCSDTSIVREKRTKGRLARRIALKENVDSTFGSSLIQRTMRREESLAYINSTRPATGLGLVPKNRRFTPEQMRGALIFSDTNSQRKISVSGMGQFSLPPDRVKLVLIISSTKSNVEEAKTSVQRRWRYVDQTLRNYGVKDVDKTVVQTINRRDTMFEVSVEITALFVDVQRYQLAHNQLVEKLDTPVVQVLDPVFFHSTLRLENIKRQASVQAVRNAKHTAEDVARTVGLYVSKAVEIVEEDFQEKEGILSLPSQPNSFQNLIDAKTLTVHVTLNVTFELKAKERHHHHHHQRQENDEKKRKDSDRMFNKD